MDPKIRDRYTDEEIAEKKLLVQNNIEEIKTRIADVTCQQKEVSEQFNFLKLLVKNVELK